jgi:PAS domain S-box-containing protein
MQPVPDNTIDVDTSASPGEGMLLGAHGITMLRRVCLVMLLGGCVLILTQTRNNGLVWNNAAAYSVTALGGLSLLLIRQGWVRPALNTVLWGILLVLLANCFIISGVRTPGLAGIPFLVMTAAWLISLRVATAMGILSMLTLAGLVLVEHLGYTPPNYPRSSLTIALIYCMVLLGTLAVASGSLRSLYGRLQQVWELSRKQTQQVEQLRQSEERFAALFRANPVPSSTVDEEGRTLDVNNAWVRLFGLSAEAARGKTSQELGIWTEQQELEAIRQTMERKGFVDGLPVTFNTVNGVQHFLVYVALVKFDGARRLVTSLLDQTDRLAAEAAQRSIHHALETRVAQRTEELSRTVAKLTTAHEELVQSEKLASLGAMVAGISHELNTPIGNTLTVSSTLHSRVDEFRKLAAQGTLKRSELTEFLDLLQEMSDLISRSTERAAELISSFKQVAVDRSSERRRVFDVRQLADDIVTSLKPGMRYAHVDITIDIPPGIVCDSFPGPAGQVLTNLVQNAVTHAFAEGATGLVAIQGQEQGEQIIITVRDNGKGMSPHTQKHAFDPFFTTRMGQGGSGLGLSVSHHIATNMLGGSLSVASALGEGSCFTFSFLRRAPAQS